VGGIDSTIVLCNTVLTMQCTLQAVCNAKCGRYWRPLWPLSDIQ